MNHFNEILKRRRIALGLRQQDLADILQVGRYSISDWESGRSEPSIADLRKLCIILDISADELLEIDTQIQRKNLENSIKLSKIKNQDIVNTL